MDFFHLNQTEFHLFIPDEALFLSNFKFIYSQSFNTVPSKKLIQLLAAFSAAEAQSLSRMLQRLPLPEGSVAIHRQLLELILKGLKQHQQGRQQDQLVEATYKQLGKDYVWRKLFSRQPYNDLALRRYCSELGGYALEAVARHHQSAADVALTQLEWLGRHELPLHFQQLNQKLEDRSTADATDYLFRFQLAALRHRYAERTNDPALDMQALSDADHYLECFYAAQKLRHLCDTLGYRHFKANAFQLNVAPEWLAQLPRSEVIRQPLVALYWRTALMWQQPEDEDRFKLLKVLLHDNLGELPEADRKTLFTHACNYCIDTKINTGRLDYFQELFDLYRLGLASGALLAGGVIQPQDYKNIITVGLHVKAFDWVEGFIHEYTERLPAEDQHNALSYNLAKVYFSQGQYRKVLEQLQEIDYPNVVYALGARLLLLKTYYELDEYLALDSLIDSFRIYLQRNKVVSADVKKQYLNVLRFVKKLSRLAPYDREGLRKIREQVAACRSLADKQWILNKIEGR